MSRQARKNSPAQAARVNSKAKKVDDTKLLRYLIGGKEMPKVETFYEGAYYVGQYGTVKGIGNYSIEQDGNFPTEEKAIAAWNKAVRKLVNG